MAVAKWIGSTRGTNPVGVLTTQLDGLVDAAGVVSNAVTNAELDTYADLELVVQFGVAPTADRTFDLYLVRQIDGTNYEQASATRPPANGFVGSFALDAVTTLQRMVINDVRVPPLAYKYLLVNKSGQTAAASANTLKEYRYNMQVV